MNFLKAKAEGGQVHLTDGTPVHIKVADHVTGDVVVGIRPEHLVLNDNGSLKIIVDEVEPTGSETHISATTSVGIPIKLVTTDRVTVETGETLTADYEADKLHLFDAKTTNRIETL
jgi:multiple sugar transport system ATP-binding protein